MEEVHLNKEVSAEMLLKALEKAARDSGGKFVSSGQSSRGGRRVIFLGSAREETIGSVTTFEPSVEIPLPNFPDKFLEKARLVLSFKDEKWVEKGSVFCGPLPSWSLREHKTYSMILMDFHVVGERKRWARAVCLAMKCVPVIGWFAFAFSDPLLNSNNRYESGLGDEAKEVVKTAYMNYFNRLGEALKT